MAAERGPGGRFKPRVVPDETAIPRETTVSRDPPPAPPSPIGPLHLVVEDVTPAIPRTGTAAPPMALPPEAGDAGGPEIDDVPLYVAATRGLDWGIGQALGPAYQATEPHRDAVAEAAAPLARRLADLVGAAGVVDATTPLLLRELTLFAAAVYVAWGDAAELLIREAIDAYRRRGDDDEEETDDAGAEDRSTRGADRGARGGRGRARRAGGRPGRVGGAAEDPEAAGVRPPGPGEGRGADLAGSFAHSRRLGSGAG